MSLFLNIDDVAAADLCGLNTNPADRVRAKGHDMKRVHGTEAAFAISLRKSGYHSSPHIHDFEQLNYIQEGEMWFFILDKGYHVKKGDFLRIPRMPSTGHGSRPRSHVFAMRFSVRRPQPEKTVPIILSGYSTRVKK